MNKLKEIIKVCKDNKIEPWYIEEVALNGGYELAEEGLFAYEENEILLKSSEDDIKRAIADVYSSNSSESLDKTIQECLDEAYLETGYQAWSLVKDWLFGVDDYPFDSIMVDWIDNDRERALASYDYLLSKEI